MKQTLLHFYLPASLTCFMFAVLLQWCIIIALLQVCTVPTGSVQTGAESLASIHICRHSKHDLTPIVYPEAIQGAGACVSVVGRWMDISSPMSLLAPCAKSKIINPLLFEEFADLDRSEERFWFIESRFFFFLYLNATFMETFPILHFSLAHFLSLNSNKRSQYEISDISTTSESR